MYIYVKRALDFILALIGLIVISPVYLFIIIAIKIESPGPVLFKQTRVGVHKKPFTILKFRTMRIEAPNDVPTHMLDNPEKYKTKVGKIIRRASLDEIPQLLNILGGSMSIIGPRPALWNQYDLIAERDKYGANDVLPGLTGWAQVNGRDELPMEVKARLDGEYAQNMSFLMDLKCFLMTIIVVIKHDGFSEGKRESVDPQRNRTLKRMTHVAESLKD